MFDQIVNEQIEKFERLYPKEKQIHIKVNVYEVDERYQFLEKLRIGIYHSAVVFEEYNLEIAYGGHDMEGTGIYFNQNGECIQNFKYLKTINYGICMISGQIIKKLVNQLRIRYSGKNYNLIKFNCNNFTQDVLKFLQNYVVQKERDFILPAEINRAAKIVKFFPDIYNGVKNKFIIPLVDTFKQ